VSSDWKPLLWKRKSQDESWVPSSNWGKKLARKKDHRIKKVKKGRVQDAAPNASARRKDRAGDNETIRHQKFEQAKKPGLNLNRGISTMMKKRKKKGTKKNQQFGKQSGSGKEKTADKLAERTARALHGIRSQGETEKGKLPPCHSGLDSQFLRGEKGKVAKGLGRGKRLLGRKTKKGKKVCSY